MKRFNQSVLYKKYIRHRRLEILSGLVVLLSLLFFTLALKPELSRKIPVLESAQNVVSICKDKLNWRDCYGKQLALINYRLKFPLTLKILDQIKQLDGKTRDCHLIAHRIATSEVDKSPKDWIKIFDYVDQTTCTNRYVHGVLEGRGKYDSSLVLDEKTIPDICSQIENRTSARVGKMREGADDACAHIIGHILLAQEDAVIQKAVETCSKVPSNIRRSCFDGIFMENITRENLEAHEVAQKFALTKAASLGLEENCRQYRGEAGLSCWRELAHIYTSFTYNDPNEVYPLCYQNKNQDYARECFMHSVNLMILSDNYTEANLADTCKQYAGNENEAKNCISRALTPLLGSSVDFIDRAAIFCNSQPKEFQQFCYTKVGQELKPRASVEKRTQLCEKVPQKFLNYCLLKN